MTLVALIAACSCAGGPDAVRVDSPAVTTYKQEVRELRQYLEGAVTAWDACRVRGSKCQSESAVLELAARSIVISTVEPMAHSGQAPTSPRVLPPCLTSLNDQLAASGGTMIAAAGMSLSDGSDSTAQFVAEAQRAFEGVVAKIEAVHC